MSQSHVAASVNVLVDILGIDVAAVFHSSSLKKSGFGALIRKEAVQPGRYEIGVYVESNGIKGIRFSGKFVEIKK